MVEVSVCIATRGRPAGLARLLESLAAQQGAPPFETVVVDNDPAGSARAVTERFSDRLAIVYDIESVPGVSTARNRSVKISQAPLLAFIDDDERAEPGWLAALHEKMSNPEVAAAIGVVTFEFDTDVPHYRRSCRIFQGLEFVDGEILKWWGAWIGNSLIRRSALPDPPFEAALNLVGGEDSHLFDDMIAGGARIVAARRAITVEHRSAARMRLADLLGRALRGGATDLEIEWLKRHRRLRARIRYGVQSIVIGSAHLVLGIVCWIPARAFALSRLMDAAKWSGRLGRLVGWRYREYRITR